MCGCEFMTPQMQELKLANHILSKTTYILNRNKLLPSFTQKVLASATARTRDGKDVGKQLSQAGMHRGGER